MAASGCPVTTMLTAVQFIGEKEGWAVGHGGVILHTIDGGMQWRLQHTAEGQPALLSVYFQNNFQTTPTTALAVLPPYVANAIAFPHRWYASIAPP